MLVTSILCIKSSTVHQIFKNIGWLVVLRINVDLAIFQPYLDLEAGDNQSLKIQVARPGIEPRSSYSASQELNHSANTANQYVVKSQNKNVVIKDGILQTWAKSFCPIPRVCFSHSPKPLQISKRHVYSKSIKYQGQSDEIPSQIHRWV